MAEITVTVKLFASLRRFQPKSAAGPVTLRLPAGARVRDAVAALGIPEESTGIAAANDVHLELETPLDDGVVLSLFPPLAGGAGAPAEAARDARWRRASDRPTTRNGAPAPVAADCCCLVPTKI